MRGFYMIGNTHFDPVWLWRWDEAMSSIHATFRSALDRMEEEPDFKYSFATPPVFEWIKEIDPDMMSEIKTRVAEGRWELAEGWWLQPDCYSASGESYARQALYGQRYLMENFGTYADTVFNIDSFGHNSATPEILSKSHVKYYCMVRPEAKHMPLESPYFEWVGKSGASVRAFRSGERAEVYTKNVRGAIKSAEGKVCPSDCDELVVYGVTNHGGAPTKAAINDIKELSAASPYPVKMATVREYFEAQSQPRVKLQGEMITGDFGPYVNGNGVKRDNRRAEYTLLFAERASVLAKHLLDRPYPTEKLRRAWESVMFCQFHDILGGASIKEAYVDARDMQGGAISECSAVMNYALTAIAKNVKTLGENPGTPWNVTVFNLGASDFEGYLEAEVQWLHEFPAYKGEISLVDKDGTRYPCQPILEGSVIDGFRSRFVFYARVGAFGYKTFRLVQDGGVAERIKNDDSSEFCGEYYSVKLSDGHLSVTDKCGRNLDDLVVPRVYADGGDTWCFNIASYGESVGEFSRESYECIESGAHRTKIKEVYTLRDSRLTLYYTFYESSPYFDLEYRADWREPHTVLKLEVNTPYKELRVASPFYSEIRGNTAADVPMGEWLTLSGEDGELSVLSDGIFAYNFNNGVLGLSVLRSCIYGDLRIAPLDPSADYPIMEEGITEGKLRFVLNNSDTGMTVPAMASFFNAPPKVIVDSNHGGKLPPEASFVRLDSATATVSAIKSSEDGDGWIVRIAESFGVSHTAVLEWFGRSFATDLSAYEIKTLKITDKGIEEVLITED